RPAVARGSGKRRATRAPRRCAGARRGAPRASGRPRPPRAQRDGEPPAGRGAVLAFALRRPRRSRLRRRAEGGRMKLLTIGASNHDVCGVRDCARMLEPAFAELGLETSTVWWDRFREPHPEPWLERVRAERADAVLW